MTTQRDISIVLAHLFEQRFSSFKFKIDNCMHMCWKPVSKTGFSESMALKMAEIGSKTMIDGDR